MPCGDLPLVSIGLPVFNGADYLEQSIQSLLDQTYPNIELIICDNASSDGTQQLCERMAASDDRIRYYRNESNIGGAKNHNMTFELSRGKYFRWAAHDDVAEPKLIERCVAVLETHDDVVLCHTDFAHIDVDGTVTDKISRNHCSSTKPYERFAAMASTEDFCEETYGVIRSEVFGRTHLQQDYTGSDRTLMSEIALYGRFVNVEEPLFRKRLHPGNVYVDWRTRMAWFGDRYKGRIVLPWWKQLADYLRVIRRVPLTSVERARCNLYMLRWIAKRSHGLARDLVFAAAMLVRSPGARMQQFTESQNWDSTSAGKISADLPRAHGRRPKRIGLMGPYGYGNLGDALVIDAVIAEVRRRNPDCVVSGFSLDPADTERRHSITSYPISRTVPRTQSNEDIGFVARSMSHLLTSPNPAARRLGRVASRVPAEFGVLASGYQALGTVDVLMACGSGQLQDSWGGGGPFSYPYTLLTKAALARLRGVEFIVVSVGAGPIDARLSKVFFRWALSLASYRSFRDEWSKQLVVDEVGIGQNDPVFPDMAFSSVVSRDRAGDASDFEAGCVVGIGPIGYCLEGRWPEADAARFAAYLDTMESFVTALFGRGYRVVFLKGEAYYDQQAIDLLIERLAARHTDLEDRILHLPVDETGGLLDAIECCDVVVASRFHNVVLSYMLGRPVLALSYQSKFESLMADFHQERFCIPIADASATTMLAKFDELIAQPDFEASVRKVVERKRKELEHQYEIIFAGL